MGKLAKKKKRAKQKRKDASILRNSRLKTPERSGAIYNKRKTVGTGNPLGKETAIVRKAREV